MKKPERFIAIADNHGDMIDPETERALFAFMADFKPSVRVHLGDNFDFRNLRKGASDDEKAASLEDDWAMGSDFLRRFFDGGKRKHFLRGNHDERIYHFGDSATGLLRDYARDGIKRLESIVKRAGAEMLPYHVRKGILKLGSLKCLHGYAAGLNASQVHARVYRNCIFGHIHSIASAPVESDDGPQEARCIGAICQIDMPYNSTRTATLRQDNGWAYGLLFPDGSYQLFQTRKIKGKFYAAHEATAY
jgi:hypothetical protein